MSDLTRRSALKQATTLALAAGSLIPAAVHAKPPSGAEGVTDRELVEATRSPQSYMFHEQVTFQLKGERRNTDLYITSAKDAQGRKTRVHVPSAVLRVVRADAGVDDFTKQGGVYYQLGKTVGKIQFKEPGRLILIVRDADATVRCYRLAPDLRC